MKQFRKFLLALMCVAVMGVVTACGSENNQTNDITDGTGDGGAEEIGDDVRDSAEEIGDDVKDGVDDVRDRADDAADGTDDRTDNAR